MWRIGEILIQKRLITWEQLGEALAEQKQTRAFLGEILLKKNFVTPHLFYKSLADQFGMRFVDLERIHVNPKAVDLIPYSIAAKYNFIPIDIAETELVIALSDPLTQLPEPEIKQMAGVDSLSIVLCLPRKIEQALEELYNSELI